MSRRNRPDNMVNQVIQMWEITLEVHIGWHLIVQAGNISPGYNLGF